MNFNADFISKLNSDFDANFNVDFDADFSVDLDVILAEILWILRIFYLPL